MISVTIDTSGIKRAAKKIQKLVNSIETAENKTNEEIPKKAAPEIERAARTAVEDWYMAYSPDYYNRKESLLHVYDVKPQVGLVNVHLSSDELGGHRVSNDYIYNLMFLQGWHGGALHDGFPPLYRTGMNFSEWGRPAEKTTSAYLLMQQYIGEMKYEIQELTWNTFRGYLKW